MLVASNGQQLFGWLELNRLRPMRLCHVVMLTLAVAASHRRQGIGRSLIRKGFLWALRSGVKKISLHVRARNVAAIELYRCEGVIIEGCERGHIRIEDGFEDNVIMAKTVGHKGGLLARSQSLSSLR
jgi:ribosomal protein S18 acetylase RimI-like enzyme